MPKKSVPKKKAKQIFPCDDLLLRSRPGERWKAIEGYEDSYQVSSHGRIRSLERLVDTTSRRHDNPIRYYITPRIRKQKVLVRHNSFTGAPHYECIVSLRSEGESKMHLVSRLVYHAFKRPLDFVRDRLMIAHLDDDGRNNFPVNLKAITRSEATQKAYLSKRLVSPMVFKSKQQLKAIQKRSAIARWKPVQRISASGRVIKNYESIQAASKHLGIPSPNIVEVLKKRKEMTHGMYWRYREV